jgi:rod shape-determining protein MreD
MQTFALVVAIYAASVLQTAGSDAIRVGEVAPDLLALLAAIWLVTACAKRGFAAAALSGLASDLIAPGPLGLGMTCFLLAGYGLVRLRTKVELHGSLAQAAVVWGAVTLMATGVAVAGWLAGAASVPLATVLARALGVGIYTGGLAWPLLMLVHGARGRLQPSVAHVEPSHLRSSL